MTEFQIALVALTVFVAAVTQGTTSMGFALISAPVIALIDPSLLPVWLLIMMVPLNVYVVLRERFAIDYYATKWISLGRIAGTFGGVWILVAIPLSWLSTLIGIAIILASLASFLIPVFNPGKKALTVAGLITGVAETATGIGGPPLAIACQHMPVATLRATAALCFLIGQIVSLVVLALSGRTNAHQFMAALLMMPALLAGMWVSHLIHHRINARVLRRAVLFFALVSGAIILWRA
ncbi:MAG: sulfite exporter TauE/SafE family protein [Candidimonas sp.]|nr:MAG: sulfite exporter TauE/SafE family protein [Candidimonas sp.]TAM26924.1 MAG: sulfite exporter TauE/SafE family protein [Candidimonas sp.]